VYNLNILGHHKGQRSKKAFGRRVQALVKLGYTKISGGNESGMRYLVVITSRLRFKQGGFL
jgi:hypothetical protein